MLCSGTVVADSDTVIEDGAVVTDGDAIAFVGDRETAVERYPDHECRAFDVVAPGMVNAHIHSVQTLGRGTADDEELLDWLFDHVLPMEAAMDREAMEVTATLGYVECVESGVTTVVDHLSVDHADAAFEAAGEDVLLAHCVWPDESERGITVALGNDGPPCNNTLDPFTEMRQASLLAKVDGYDATTLPAEAVVEMATIAGARAAGFERVGRLRQGWRADVIGLDSDAARRVPVHDPLSALVYATHGDDVTFTMVDGTVVYEDSDVRTVDAGAVRKRAQDLAERYAQ